MKPAKACRQCRETKKKCEIPSSNAHAACISCQRRKIECSRLIEFTTSKRLAPSSSTNADDANTETIPLSYQTVVEFVGLYLRFIHDRPQSLFHEKTLWADIYANTISTCLLMAICAMGCRFSNNAAHRGLVKELRRKSTSLFSRQLEVISLSNVQTCILLANLYAAELENELEALYFGIANRMARILRLHKSCPDDLPILREVKCRVWWTLFMADKWCPPGLGLPRETMMTDQSLDLPMDEVYFQEMDEATQVQQQPRKSGLWKYMIMLADILGPVQDLNLLLVQRDYDGYTAGQQVLILAERLQIWSDTLPGEMVLNEHNLDRYRGLGRGGAYVALHLGYHHYSTLLYYQYLDGGPEPTSEWTSNANRCRFHALCFSRLLQRAREKGNCEVVYLTVAHMTMVSSSVLLHMLLLGTDEEVDTARTQLARNFEALVELRAYWPHMDQITRRLMTFQNACLRSTNNRTHQINKWMVRFLLEHALPLEEKGVKSDNLGLIDCVSPLTPNHEVPLERTQILSEAFADLYG